MSARTPGPWIYDAGDNGDDSVGMAPTPPTVCADPDGDGNVYPVCTLDVPIRAASKLPADVPDPDEYGDAVEWSGDVNANGRAIAAVPDLIHALRAYVDGFVGLHEARGLAIAALAKLAP